MTDRYSFPFLVAPTERQIWAIGMVAVQWAHLESFLWIILSELTAIEGACATVVKPADPFVTRMRQAVFLAGKLIVEPHRTALLDLFQRASNLQDQRHKIVYGQAGEDPLYKGAAERIHVFQHPGGGSRPFDWKLTYAQIRDVAMKIATLNADLMKFFVTTGMKPGQFTMRSALRHISQPPNPPPASSDHPLDAAPSG